MLCAVSASASIFSIDDNKRNTPSCCELSTVQFYSSIDAVHAMPFIFINASFPYICGIIVQVGVNNYKENLIFVYLFLSYTLPLLLLCMTLTFELLTVKS